MRPPAPWTILDVDLDGPAPALDSAGGAEALVMAFRRRGAVLGRLCLLPENLPLTGREVEALAAKAIAPAVADLLGGDGAPVPFRRARQPRVLPDGLGDDPLARLDRIIERRRARPMPVSATLVICTRGRPAELYGCLTSIRRAVPPELEIIVVENGPERPSEQVVREFPEVRHVAEPEGGLSRARNTGMRAASGQVVAFVDDDVRPEAGWLAPLLQAFGDPAVAVACGLVLPDELATDAQVAFETELGFGGMGFAPLVFDARFTSGWPRGVPVWNIGAGASMAVRRDAALATGGFDERLGPGALGGCGEDSEFWRRILFRGHSIVYEPFSVVRHRHRRDWAALERQAHSYSLGHVTALFAQYAVTGDHGDLLRAFAVLPRHLLRKTAAQSLLWLRGHPDRLLRPAIRGYLSGLAHIGLVRGTRDAPGSRAGDAGRRWGRAADLARAEAEPRPPAAETGGQRAAPPPETDAGPTAVARRRAGASAPVAWEQPTCGAAQVGPGPADLFRFPGKRSIRSCSAAGDDA